MVKYIRRVGVLFRFFRGVEYIIYEIVFVCVDVRFDFYIFLLFVCIYGVCGWGVRVERCE